MSETAKVHTRALYAGSFDPPTVGHMAIIESAARTYDELEVSVGVNAKKTPHFSTEERVAMLQEVTRPLGNVSVSSFSNKFLIRYAAATSATHIVRGLRNSTDFEEEAALFKFNYKKDPSIQTVYLRCSPELEIVSSSFVKGCVGLEGWEDEVSDYVHPFVLEALKARLQ